MGAGKLILAVAFQTFSIGPADAFRKRNSIVLKIAKTTILGVVSRISANRLEPWTPSLPSRPRTKESFTEFSQ